MIEIKKENRRFYFQGQTFEVRHTLKEMGAHWDPYRRAWWVGKLERAEQILKEIEKEGKKGEEQKEDLLDAIVYGKAIYKGKTYYIAGAGDEDHLRPITTRTGEKILLYFQNGNGKFWAPTNETQVIKTYERPKTIRRLREFAREMKELEQTKDRTSKEEVRQCWECGCLFTKREAYLRHGDWNDYYCGC